MRNLPPSEFTRWRRVFSNPRRPEWQCLDCSGTGPKLISLKRNACWYCGRVRHVEPAMEPVIAWSDPGRVSQADVEEAHRVIGEYWAERERRSIRRSDFSRSVSCSEWNVSPLVIKANNKAFVILREMYPFQASITPRSPEALSLLTVSP